MGGCDGVSLDSWVLETTDMHKSGWWFQLFFIFTPKIGEMIQFDEHFFQMGWFNHQLDKWMFEFCSSMGCKYHPDNNEGFVPSSCPPVTFVGWEESRPHQGDGVTHVL